RFLALSFRSRAEVNNSLATNRPSTAVARSAGTAEVRCSAYRLAIQTSSTYLSRTWIGRSIGFPSLTSTSTIGPLGRSSPTTCHVLVDQAVWSLRNEGAARAQRWSGAAVNRPWACRHCLAAGGTPILRTLAVVRIALTVRRVALTLLEQPRDTRSVTRRR